MMKREILEKIYAGLIGMDAGMRLGAPVENPYWTYERLRDYYGDMRGYLRVHKNHTADDDVNGPMILVRALMDNGTVNGLTPEMCGEAWLNYTRFGKGMFWWGGEDVSTEHRAYMNLRRGVKPPESGSAGLNGRIASEQIGGQIFVDTWGLIWPDNPEKAAEYARCAACVSHDGSGLDGAAFMAACSSAAFSAESVDAVIDAGLSVLPEKCDYRDVVRAVREFHGKHPGDFRACQDYVTREWGHDRFPGGWHIIPNAGICLTGLLYGGGDLGRSIEISVMCGFDTDCNASSIGTILGVFGGLEGVPARYREPINDTVILSGVSGYLNTVDLPSLAGELFETAEMLASAEDRAVSEDRAASGVPAVSENRAALTEDPSVSGKRAGAERGDLVFDFALPGSTHGLMLSERAGHTIRNTAYADFGAVCFGSLPEGQGELPADAPRCLELMIDGKRTGPADLFFRGCLIRSDLEDERYEPVFSPRVYPGQTVLARMRARHIAPAEVTATPYVTFVGERLSLGEAGSAEWLHSGSAELLRAASEEGPAEIRLNFTPSVISEREWTELSFRIPDLCGCRIHDVGWRFSLVPDEDPWGMSFVLIDRISVSGQMDWSVDFGQQRVEFGQVTPFSMNDCRGSLRAMTGEGETPSRSTCLVLSTEDEPTADGCQAFTGNYYQRDGSISARAAVVEGDSAVLLLRGQGTRRYYALGFSGEDRAVILRCRNGMKEVLAEGHFPWERGREYLLSAEAEGERLSLSVDGRQVLSAEDARIGYGMPGLGMTAPGQSTWRDVCVRGVV
ncbi:MAG: ADP-ribosylglycohydrolase family protein [Lachnospiraceae bacterium]|nr:ADP-ribosylglycohydrolase family protein [Lachnospiraceae bacterium]